MACQPLLSLLLEAFQIEYAMKAVETEAIRKKMERWQCIWSRKLVLWKLYDGSKFFLTLIGILERQEHVYWHMLFP